MRLFDKARSIWKAPSLGGHPQVYVTPLVVIGMRLRAMCFTKNRGG